MIMIMIRLKIKDIANETMTRRLIQLNDVIQCKTKSDKADTKLN
jgi:hypothetical protein